MGIKEKYMAYYRGETPPPEPREPVTAEEKLFLARERNRPIGADFLDHLLDEKVLLSGDRLQGDDGAILSGIGKLEGRAISFVAIDKGKSLEEKIEKNFGMVRPEGYRKARRILKQAEKFNRPVLTILDTPGAYPGIEAEERGQSFALAESLLTLSRLRVPVVSVITSEGYSGGALSLALSDELLMLEYAVYSILSPEGFGSILYRDAGEVQKACEMLHFTAEDMLQAGICDEIIGEEPDPSYRYMAGVYKALKARIAEGFDRLVRIDRDTLIRKRLARFDRWD